VLRERDDLIVVLLGSFVFTALGMNFPIFISTMATLEFGAGANGFGILVSTAAIGSVVGALLNARRERPRLRTIVLAALGFGVVTAASALAPTVWLYGLLLVGLGMTSLIALNSSNAYVQISTPTGARGRIMAIYLAIVRGSTVFGAPFIGWVTDNAGPRWAIAVGALGGLVPTLMIGIWWMAARHGRIRWTARPCRISIASRAEPD